MASERLNNGVSRRTALKVIGGSAAVLGTSGLVSAGPPERGPPRGVGQCECPDGTVLLAKYEVDGGFEYEKHGDFLDLGDHYTFEVLKTKEDGEILKFEVETDGAYRFDGLTVKTGEGCFEKTFGDAVASAKFDVREYDRDHPVQAVSNVQVCARPRWQADFGTGPVPEPPAYGRTDDASELLMAEFGSGYTDSDAWNPDVDYRAKDLGVTVTSTGFDVANGKICVSFEVTEDDTTVHVATFKRPGSAYPTKDINVEEQELHAKQVRTYDSGATDTLCVDLPSVDDFTT